MKPQKPSRLIQLASFMPVRCPMWSDFNTLALRAKVDDPRSLLCFLIASNRLLPELTNRLAATQTGQVCASKDEVARAVLTTGLIDQRGIGGHAISINFRRGRAAPVRVQSQLRNAARQAIHVALRKLTYR